MKKHQLNLAAVFLLCLLTTLWLAAQSPVHVVLMHTNDLHGQLKARNGLGGFAEIAAMVRSARPDLLIDAGDLFTGTFLSDEFKGVPIILAMNAIGFSAAAVGNHEFDYGQEALRLRVTEARFPFLSANLETPIPNIRKYTVLNSKGIRFGIIGVTTAELATTTHPRNLSGVKVSDAVTSIRRLLPEVRKQADVVIVTAHVTDAEERRIAAAFPEIPLIIGGHNHSAIGPIRANKTTIVKTGNSGRNIGRVDLYFEGKVLRKIEGSVLPVARVQPDKEITDLLAPFEVQITARLAKVVGEAAGEFSNSSTQESTIGNLVSDAMRAAAGTDIAIENTGGIRARIPKGPITWGTVFEVLPFNNTIVTMRMTGAQLRRVLGVRLLAVSGLRMQLNLQARTGRKLISATLPDGTPLDNNSVYTVATNDFLVAGGDGISEFSRGRDARDTGIFLHNALADYISTKGTVAPSLDGRISIVAP